MSHIASNPGSIYVDLVSSCAKYNRHFNFAFPTSKGLVTGLGTCNYVCTLGCSVKYIAMVKTLALSLTNVSTIH